MPIDARIPLGVEGPDPNAFTNALAAGMKMREVQNASQRLDLAENRLARKDEAATAEANALAEYGRSPRGQADLDRVWAKAPGKAMTIEKSGREAALADVQAKQAKLVWAKANHQLLADGAAAVLSNPTRENATMVLDSLEAQGGDMTVARTQLGTSPDEQIGNLAKGWGMNATKIGEMARQEAKDAEPKIVGGQYVYPQHPEMPATDIPGVTQKPSAADRQRTGIDAADARQQRQWEHDAAVAVAKRTQPTPQIAQKTREKLQTLDIIDAQLNKVEDSFLGTKNPDGTRKRDGIQNTYSAGLGAGYLPTQGGRGFDASVDGLRPFLRQLSRTPGEGSMSDYETKQAEALLPSRNDHESVTEQKIKQLRDIAKQLRSSMAGAASGASPAAPPAQAPAPAGRPAPAMVPGADPGVTRDQVEAEMRRRGLLLP